MTEIVVPKGTKISVEMKSGEILEGEAYYVGSYTFCFRDHEYGDVGRLLSDVIDLERII